MKIEIEKTLETLRAGGIILYPTDTIWGIGCDATNYEAVKRIYKIKKRNENKSLISLAYNTVMINNFTDFKQLQIKLPESPTTIIYQNVKGLAENIISNKNTAAFRVPNDQFCSQLINLFGSPIASTSANISGAKPPDKFSEITEEIKDSVDYIVNLRQDEIMNIPSSIILINEDKSVKKIR